MVNKAVLGVVAVVVLASMTVGGLVAAQLGGTDDPAAGQGTGDSSGATDAGGTDATPTSVPTTAGGATPATASPTPTEVRTTVAARSFNETRIAVAVVERINEGRERAGVEPLAHTGTTARQLDRMALNHSRAMAATGATIHEINGTGTADRYKSNGLYSRCSYEPPDKNGLREPTDGFETVGSTVAGRHYETAGGERFHGTESAVAATLVDGWLDSNVYGDRLLAPGLERLGVGVTVRDDGETYVAVDLCG
ncbi:CAP domain-containing protein [Halomicrobium salinisoli]|uniref:CAP domain-containing protein n=1 Tax=Halomicrobium salinisoli TaxID=2878391 RepID=UPI001CF021D2|nr:CAP domain-containing protein [Halomicrobium salinisoli]